jgi:hypothetical protein
MDFKEITVTLLDVLLTAPSDDMVSMPRYLCNDIYNLMLKMTQYYGPNMTVKKFKDMLDA